MYGTQSAPTSWDGVKWSIKIYSAHPAHTVVRKFAILVSFGILVVFVALELQSNARVWYSHWEIFN